MSVLCLESTDDSKFDTMSVPNCLKISEKKIKATMSDNSASF